MPNTVTFNPNDAWGNDDDTFNEQPESAEQNVSEVPTKGTPEVSANEQGEASAPLESVNGVSLEDLEVDDTQPETQAATQEEKPLGYDQFASDFKKYIGVDLDGAKQMLAELQAFRIQTLVEKQQGVLKSKWGDAYDDRFQQVTAYFAKLPPAKQQALDNPEGAELIWAKISADQSKAAQSQTPQVPNFVSGRTTTQTSRANTGNKAVILYSDILAMSPKEYKAKQKEIQQAFDEGRVDMDESDSPF